MIRVDDFWPLIDDLQGHVDANDLGRDCLESWLNTWHRWSWLSDNLRICSSVYRIIGLHHWLLNKLLYLDDRCIKCSIISFRLGLDFLYHWIRSVRVFLNH